MEIISDHTIL